MQCRVFFAGLVAAIFATFPSFSASATSPATWNLPIEVNDGNTQVSFSVDTTWHMVHGKTAGLSGKVWLADPKDPSSVHAEIHLPVASFNTDSEGRDKKLRKVMAQEQFADVLLKIEALDGACTPEKVTLEPCQATMSGSLAIRGLIRELRLPYSIKREGEHYRVSGDFTFQWADFGVEDPSILIAHVDKDVSIHYSMLL